LKDMTKSAAVKKIAEKADMYARRSAAASARQGQLCLGTEAVRAAVSSQALRKFLHVLDEGGSVVEAELQAKQFTIVGIVKWNEKHGRTLQIWEESLHSRIESARRDIEAEIRKESYDFPAPGCYIDESAGSVTDGCRRTIDFAAAYGFSGIGENYEDEFLGEISDEAVDFLNGLETRDKYYWLVDDNSLFLMILDENGEPIT